MAANSDDDGMSDKPSVIVFDFDQTLSITHVFKILAGFEQAQSSGNKSPFAIKPPFAFSEKGQLKRTMELEDSKPGKSWSHFVMGGRTESSGWTGS